MDIPQLAEELFINSFVQLEVQDKQSQKAYNFLPLINFMSFIWNSKVEKENTLNIILFKEWVDRQRV